MMTFLIMCSKTIDRKLPLGCFQTNSTNKTLLVLSLAVSRVLGLISRHCVCGILHHMKMFRVLHILDSLLVSFPSCVMGFVSHGGFTVQCMITLAVLDAQMNLTLSHNTCVPAKLSTMALRHWTSWTHFSMPIIDTALTLQTLNFGDCMTGRVRLMTAITPANTHATKQFVLLCLSWRPARSLPNVRSKTSEQWIVAPPDGPRSVVRRIWEWSTDTG